MGESPGTRRQRVWWSAQQEHDALREPARRESMDVLESMLMLDCVAARAALDAIIKDAHRGWIDILLGAHANHVRWGLLTHWQQTCLACVGEGGMDADVVALLRPDQPCEAKIPVTILRVDRSALSHYVRTRRPHHYTPLQRGLLCLSPSHRIHKNLVR